MIQLVTVTIAMAEGVSVAKTNSMTKTVSLSVSTANSDSLSKAVSTANSDSMSKAVSTANRVSLSNSDSNWCSSNGNWSVFLNKNWYVLFDDVWMRDRYRYVFFYGDWIRLVDWYSNWMSNRYVDGYFNWVGNWSVDWDWDVFFNMYGIRLGYCIRYRPVYGNWVRNLNWVRNALFYWVGYWVRNWDRDFSVDCNSLDDTFRYISLRGIMNWGSNCMTNSHSGSSDFSDYR